eukprot:scaffold553_cov238-Pinguiococcus_pyrenoidosus.AAC.9
MKACCVLQWQQRVACQEEGRSKMEVLSLTSDLLLLLSPLLKSEHRRTADDATGAGAVQSPEQEAGDEKQSEVVPQSSRNPSDFVATASLPPFAQSQEP